MEFPAFAVACGEEASDPLVAHAGSVVRVDELALSGHLSRQDADLADVVGLGITVWRYGMPWRLSEPEPGVYDWSWWDRALAACERAGLTPVVDLCHFACPTTSPGSVTRRGSRPSAATSMRSWPAIGYPCGSPRDPRCVRAERCRLVAWSRGS